MPQSERRAIYTMQSLEVLANIRVDIIFWILFLNFGTQKVHHICTFSELRRVIERYSEESLPSVPSDNERMGYGSVRLLKKGNLLDMLHSFEVIESENPLPMESVGQVHIEEYCNFFL